jgi:cell division protein FtsQ
MAKPRRGAVMQQTPKVKQPRPPVPWKSVFKHSAALLLVVLLVAGGVYLREADTLPVKHVTVDGSLRHTDRNELVKAVMPYVRGSFLNVDVASIQKAGETLPWVEQIQVRRVWPDTLHLIVAEHEAVARWNNDGLVNRHGKVFKPSKDTMPDGLIQLNGPDGMSEMMSRRLVDVQQKVNVLGLRVISMSMDKRRAWQVDFKDGLHLKLGRTDDEQRLDRFVTVYLGGLGSFKELIKEIDMRYTNGLAVVWKSGQQPDFNGTV